MLAHISPFLHAVGVGKWYTVTVTDGEGRRYSLDVKAASSYDAAHLCLTHVRGNPGCGMPIPTIIRRCGAGLTLISGGPIRLKKPAGIRELFTRGWVLSSGSR